ncbi:MAG: hypothetical protein IAF58_05180, partial [Leptolyngbya sp.]|nr:hypothetical protein [Candidatus Melainabacteria bacterium]
MVASAVTTITSNDKSTREAEFSALRRAVSIERRSRYADFQGKRSTFSQFMRTTAERMTRRYPMETIWLTVRALFRQYPNVDVATRIAIIWRAEELIGPIIEDGLASLQENGDREDGEGHASDGVAEGSGGSAALAEVAGGMSGGKSAGSRQSASAGAKSNSDLKKQPEAKLLPAAEVKIPSAAADIGKKPTISSDPDEVNVQWVKGVGPKVAALLAKLGIVTAGDLLRHYPRKHLDFQNRLPIRQLKVGMEATVFAQIRTVSAFQSKKSNISIVNVLLSDGTGSLSITRFIGGKGNKFLLDRYKEQFPKGATVIASGVVEKDKYSGKFTLKNSEVEILGMLDESGNGIEDLQHQSIHLGRLVPVYALTDGLSLRYLRNVIKNTLDAFGETLQDPLPVDLREKLGL